MVLFGTPERLIEVMLPCLKAWAAPSKPSFFRTGFKCRFTRLSGLRGLPLRLVKTLASAGNPFVNFANCAANGVEIENCRDRFDLVGVIFPCQLLCFKTMMRCSVLISPARSAHTSPRLIPVSPTVHQIVR